LVNVYSPLMNDSDQHGSRSESRWLAWGRYGHALVGVRKYQAAVAALETALRGQGDLDGRYEMLVALGDALCELGRHEEASEAYRTVTWDFDLGNCDIEDDTVALRRARVAESRKEGQLPQSLGAWELRGGHSMDWTELGCAYGEVCEDADAIERFAELLTDDASFALHAWYALGDTYKRRVLEPWRKSLTLEDRADYAFCVRALDSVDAAGRLRRLAVAALERAQAFYTGSRESEFYPPLPTPSEFAEELATARALCQAASCAAAGDTT
jgi:tetratricopeptide (TPR) repeat protein